MGKGYLEIDIDRQKAASYGVSVADIQDTIEVALGGRVVTQTVEGRERFPVRVRYARAQREDEEAVRRLLVSASGGATSVAMASASASGNPQMGGAPDMTPRVAGAESLHRAAPEHEMASQAPIQVPLGSVATVR